MRTEEMLPACEILDSMGYWSLECWGGATFDSCLRFLNEESVGTSPKAQKSTPAYTPSNAVPRTEHFGI